LLLGNDSLAFSAFKDFNIVKQVINLCLENFTNEFVRTVFDLEEVLKLKLLRDVGDYALTYTR
jgi:hypothetical protein